MSPSDASGTMTGRCQKSFWLATTDGRGTPSDRPNPFQAVTMTGTRGRPRGNTSTLRQRELLRLLAEGVPWRQAAKQARVSGDTVLGLLDRADFAAVAKAVIEERIAVTVIVGASPSSGRLAA